MFCHDPAHLGFSTSMAPTINQTLWKHPTSGPVGSSPTVANRVVYVGSYDNNIYAIGLTAPADDSGTLMITYYIIIAAVAFVIVAVTIISLVYRRRLK